MRLDARRRMTGSLRTRALAELGAMLRERGLVPWGPDARLWSAYLRFRERLDRQRA